MASTTQPTTYQLMLAYGSGGGSIFGGTGGESDGGVIPLTTAYGITDEIVEQLFAAMSTVTLPDGYTLSCTRYTYSTDTQTAVLGSDGTATFQE